MNEQSISKSDRVNQALTWRFYFTCFFFGAGIVILNVDLNLTFVIQLEMGFGKVLSFQTNKKSGVASSTEKSLQVDLKLCQLKKIIKP